MIQINDTMKEGTGKFINRKSITAGKKYDSFFVYVPAEVARDSAFPFKPGDKVKVMISEGVMIVEKVA
jgi:hypothetical protein